MDKQQNITIKIADVAPISMTIDRNTEEVVREAEYNVNLVWKAWRNEFDTKTSKEVLAMVAFQFAKKYLQLAHYENSRQQAFDDFEEELDKLLHLVSPSDTASAKQTNS